MKKYYYLINEKQFGPVDIAELKNIINTDTLVWREGLRNWSMAKDIDELSSILDEFLKKETKQSSFDLEKRKKQPAITVPKFEATSPSMFSAVFSFSGRIRRLEYGLSYVIYLVISSFLNAANASAEPSFLTIGYIPLIWFLLAQGSKRCHDLGKNGWWQLVPFYSLWMIFQKGNLGINEHGVNAKGEL